MMAGPVPSGASGLYSLVFQHLEAPTFLGSWTPPPWLEPQVAGAVLPESITKHQPLPLPQVSVSQHLSL